MSVENFQEHKRKKKKDKILPQSNTNWRNFVYNPREFRRRTNRLKQQSPSDKPAEKQLRSYSVVLVVVIVLSLAFLVLRKSGFMH